MKIKTNVQPQKQKPKTKTKINNKRLIFIFFTAFVGFFLLCTIIAKLLTPDIPALDNENNLSSVSSDDFKGRVDSRLKQIELDEGPATSTTVNPFQSKTSEPQEVDVSNINNQGYTEPKPQAKMEEDPLPYDSRDSETTDNADDNSYQDEEVAPQPQAMQPVPKPTAKQAPKKDARQQDDNLILRDKLKVQREQPATINKVMVGAYADLNEARKVSQSLTDSSLNVTPFIKERNGTYTLQVGTFSNPQKAAKLASDLRKMNLDTRVIQD